MQASVWKKKKRRRFVFRKFCLSVEVPLLLSSRVEKGRQGERGRMGSKRSGQKVVLCCVTGDLRSVALVGSPVDSLAVSLLFVRFGLAGQSTSSGSNNGGC